MSDPKFGWLDIGSRYWWRPIDHVSFSGSLTYPGMTSLHPSKLSESLRISNGTNAVSVLIFSDLLILYENVRIVVPDTWYVVKCVDNL